MKRLFSKYAAATLCIVATLFAAACSDSGDDNPTGNLAVKLTAGTATHNSLTFTVKPSGAQKCAWVCVEKGATIPSAAEILESGTAAAADKASTYEAANLAPETTYVIAAAVADANGGTASAEPLEMTTAASEFDGYDADVLVDAVYRSDNSAGAGNYVLVISNAQPAADGDPAAVGEFQMQLDLYNAADSDPVNAALPAGTYEMQTDLSAFTWNPQHSALYIRTAEGDNGVTVSPMIAGSVTVSRSGMNYTVTADMTLFTGEELKVRYTGPIPFVQGGSSSFDRFQTPQNIAFETMQGRFYGNWFYPHADDMNVEMFCGTFNENNTLVDGYYMTLPVYMPKIENPEKAQPQFIEGTYRIVTTPGASVNNIPYTISHGQYIEVFGIMVEVGAYVTHVDSKTGKRTLGLIVDGTVDVKRSGANYSVAIDFVTAEGVSIKGSYEGALTARNFCDNSSMQPRPWSTLTSDYTLVLPETTIAGAFYMGEYLIQGQESWIISVMNEGGDMITSEIMVPAGNGPNVPTGKFDISASLGPNTALPGFQSFGGDILYTWYGDLGSTDGDGYQTRLAPIAEGSITISKVGAQYKFVFDLIDDAGKSIVGEWTGAVDSADVSGNMSAAAKRVLRNARARR
ncbi:MAG: hypothetical protein K2I43_01450 [Alistipes sp.]|nr:hypothetical protein [Alistipes sp.]